MHSHLNINQISTRIGKVAVAATVAGIAIHNRERLPQLRLRLNSTFIEALSGAAGEVAQIALVYPLDTVKVRCQAYGWSSRRVIADLWQSTGGGHALLAALYAGAVPAAVLSILVGRPRSLYFGFMPYLFESLPYDFSELLVVGAGKGAMVCWLVIESCQRFLLQAAAAAEQGSTDGPPASRN
eukprot:gene10503-10663_t